MSFVRSLFSRSIATGGCWSRRRWSWWLDHFLRGAFWPFSIYRRRSAAVRGDRSNTARWVLFEDILSRDFLPPQHYGNARHRDSHRAPWRASRHANQLIMEKSRDVICANDAEGRFVSVSAACEALWGYKREELIGKSCAEMVHPDDRERSRLANLEIMAGHPVTNFENRYVRKDGKIADVLWSAYWSESEGTLFQVARDITQRKRAEVALQKTNRQLASAHQANQLIMDNSQERDLQSRCARTFPLD